MLRDRLQTLLINALTPLLRSIAGGHRDLNMFLKLQARGINVVPNHYYQPIPDLQNLPENVFTKHSALHGIDMHESRQLEYLRSIFPAFKEEYTAIPSAPTDRAHGFHLNNGYFDGTDALVHYCMVRHLKPARILECGSGFSTRLSAQAALQNLREGSATKLVAIEPFPSAVLRAGFPGLTTLIADEAEAVPMYQYLELQQGDILFIDSTHVSRISGDVNFLYLEVLPRLNKGVVVHVHDIFFPFEYPKEWVLSKLRFWNEQYLLQAFLMFNSDFEILFCNSFMGFKHPEALRATFPTSPWWGGSSLWMRRKP